MVWDLRAQTYQLRLISYFVLHPGWDRPWCQIGKCNRIVETPQSEVQ
jgi:hypothetical protein